jgi:hypothetical protein
MNKETVFVGGGALCGFISDMTGHTSGMGWLAGAFIGFWLHSLVS